MTWKQFAVALEWLGSEADMLIEAGLSAGLLENIGAFNSLVGDDKTVLLTNTIFLLSSGRCNNMFTGSRGTSMV